VAEDAEAVETQVADQREDGTGAPGDRLDSVALERTAAETREVDADHSHTLGELWRQVPEVADGAGDAMDHEESGSRPRPFVDESQVAVAVDRELEVRIARGQALACRRSRGHFFGFSDAIISLAAARSM
jgi:hypothetical protein